MKKKDVYKRQKIESGIGLKDFNGHNVDFTKIDVEKLTRDTGYRAEICFEDGIRLCCDAYLQGGK